MNKIVNCLATKRVKEKIEKAVLFVNIEERIKEKDRKRTHEGEG